MPLARRSFVAPTFSVILIGFAASQLAAAGASAQAGADTDAPDPYDLQIHGFVSQGFFLTTNNNYLTESKDGSFELTEVGVNLTQPLTEELRLGLQLFAHDLGEIGNYTIKADWFYLDYRFRDWLGFRAGRVKLPFGLYNEVHDIDSARVPILLPQAVYPIGNRDYLLAQTGAELYGFVNFGRGGALDYRLYAGTIFLDDEATEANPAYEATGVETPYVVGGRLLYETPLEGLRAGGSVQALQIDLDLTFDPNLVMAAKAAGLVPAGFAGVVRAQVPAVLWIASIEYAAYDLQLTVEFSRWNAWLESSERALLPEGNAQSERMYALISYRITTWFQPAFYYGQYYPDIHERDGRAAKQRDWALALRFDVTENWLIKLEGHVLDGTASLLPRLNGDTPRTLLNRSWLLFLAKTTAYF